MPQIKMTRPQRFAGFTRTLACHASDPALIGHLNYGVPLTLTPETTAI